MSKIGIDLGTTNSLIACWNDDSAKIIPNALGDDLTPSVVGIDDDGSVIVGAAAYQRLSTHPKMTASAFKRYMGTARQTKIGKHKFSPEELSALVLKSLKADAEAFLGEPVTDAVISVPAYFSDAQRKATKAAGQLAGLTVERLINEPTAAAIAYGLHEVDDESTFLVFDLGGGTFDTAVLELFEGVMQVHASAGDNYLGGEDFDAVLCKMIIRQLDLDPQQLDKTSLAGIRVYAERLKVSLSSNQVVNGKLVIKNQAHEVTVTREQFEQASKELLERVKAPVRRALRDASLSPEDFDAVVLVGGSTRMPMIRALSAKMLGRMPHSNIDPDKVVALGAATLSAMLQRDDALEEVVLTDVAPYSMGIGVHNVADNSVDSMGSLYSPIIERNSPIPVSRVDSFFTINDFQTEIEIDIYQGEARLVKDNIKLGEFTLTVPRARAGEQQVNVRFTYDVSGLLEVEAEVVKTGKIKRMVLDGNDSGLSQKQIEKKLTALAHLKIHPRENLEVREIIARAERIFEESLGDFRSHIRDQLSAFDLILGRQIPEEIEQAQRQFKDYLDAIEDDQFF